jgi:two-component system sensor histidine kinase KdpD
MKQDDDDKRPSPEELLEIAKQQEDQTQKRGNLTIYLGYAPGVGKTYSMLYDAHLRKKEGIDVVVGYAETHHRAETEALLEGLEIIEPQIVDYNGLTLKEVNFKKIIERKPQLVIIDELPHTNPPNFFHTKRYQDIEDVLNAGIDVYTAMNIQHIESLNDLMYQITGISIKETVPDKFIEQAKGIKLVDLTPEELLKRLKEGKVYVKNLAQSAIKKFFRSGNLLALRQIALRVVADNVDEKMKSYMKQHAIAGPWAIKEKILVGIFASPYADQLIRATYRFATEIEAQWVAVHVETQKNKDFTEDEKKWLDKGIELAQQLGGEIVWLKGDDIFSEIIDYAKEQNITKIVIGKPQKLGLFKQSIPQKIITKTENIDIYLLSPKEKKSKELFKQKKFKLANISQFIIATGNIFAATIIDILMRTYLNNYSLFAVFLLALIINALFLNVTPVILSSMLGILAFDFFFVKPIGSFFVKDLNFFLLFVIYAVIAVLISLLLSNLMNKIKQLKKNRFMEMGFYEVSINLTTASNIEQILSIVVNQLKKLFSCEVAIFLEQNKRLKVEAKTKNFNIDNKSEGIANWVFFNKKNAGLGTNTLTNTNALYMPIITNKDIYGVIGISFLQDNKVLSIEDKIALNTISHLAALAIERIKLFQNF